MDFGLAKEMFLIVSEVLRIGLDGKSNSSCIYKRENKSGGILSRKFQRFLVGGDEGVDGAVGLEVCVGGGADVFKGNRLVFGFFFFPAFVAESVEFV